MTNQEYFNTKQELHELVAAYTREMDLVNFEKFVTAAICDQLNISRNLASQYLNEWFKEGKLIKINSRPVYFFDKQALMEKFQLNYVKNEYDELKELILCIKEGMREKENFAQAAGYNLSLHSAVDKCKVAVDYPPKGLPLWIEGQRGTGKGLLAELSWVYAKDKGIVSEKSRFIKIDCSLYDEIEYREDDVIQELEQKIFQYSENDFLYLRNFDVLKEKVKTYVVGLLDLNRNPEKSLRARTVFSSETRIDAQKYYVQQMIPIQVELPSLGSRSTIEKEQLILLFLQEEEKKLGKKLLISGQAYHALLHHTYVENIIQLKKSIQISCARAFSMKKQDKIVVTIQMLPQEFLSDIQFQFKRNLSEDKYLTLEQMKNSFEFSKEEKLCSMIFEKMRECLQQKNDYRLFLKDAFLIITEYNEYILFKKSVRDDGLKGIEQTLIKIFDHIQEIYSVNISKSYLKIFARWVYYSAVFHDAIDGWQKEHKGEIIYLLEFMKKNSFNEYTVAKEVIDLIKTHMEVTLSKIELIMLVIILNEVEASVDSLPIQASIICHGYATASSIADVCNKILKRHVFNAIDMPYDVSVTEICSQLRKILYYNENRDVLLLVDIGSLENIVEMVGEVPNVNFGIMNHVSTGLALETGLSILSGETLENVMKNAMANMKPSYRLREKAKKEDAILFVSEIGSVVAEKVGELFRNSLPKNIQVTMKCCDYDTYKELLQTGELERFHILFVAATNSIKIKEARTITIEDMITFHNLDQIRIWLREYLSAEEFEAFRKNLLNEFSLQNVVESLTILNAGKVLQIVASMLDELQIYLDRKFLEKTIVGLNVHISCLIERLVKKEEIMTYTDMDRFLEENQKFVRAVQKSFEQIERQYNIQLPVSEIAYIYDYIKYESESDIQESEF